MLQLHTSKHFFDINALSIFKLVKKLRAKDELVQWEIDGLEGNTMMFPTRLKTEFESYIKYHTEVNLI